jgi:hypothetical protein
MQKEKDRVKKKRDPVPKTFNSISEAVFHWAGWAGRFAQM